MTDSLSASLMQFFDYEHLPSDLQTASKPFKDFANHLYETLPHNYQLSFALQKLIEVKDCAVRAHLFKL
jgi:hypothetical protein